MRATKEKLGQILTDVGATEIVASYDGMGDDGDIEELVVWKRFRDPLLSRRNGGANQRSRVDVRLRRIPGLRAQRRFPRDPSWGSGGTVGAMGL